MEGRQELQQYEENMTWLKETKKDFPSWFTSTLIGAKTEREKRVGCKITGKFEPAGWGRDLIVFVGLGWGICMIFISRGRGYLNRSSQDVHWDQLNVLRCCSMNQSNWKLCFYDRKLHQVQNGQRSQGHPTRI